MRPALPGKGSRGKRRRVTRFASGGGRRARASKARAVAPRAILVGDMSNSINNGATHDNTDRAIIEAAIIKIRNPMPGRRPGKLDLKVAELEEQDEFCI